MENKFLNTEGEVQISYLFTKLKSYLKYIITITLVTFGLVYFLSSQIAKPKYLSSATLIANYQANTEDTGVDEINAARNLAEIYATLIKSNDAMLNVINEHDLDLSIKDLGAEFDIEVIDKTPLITIKYMNKDSKKSQEIVESLLNGDIVNNIVEQKQVTILSKPTNETQLTIKPSNFKNAVVLSFLTGVFTLLIIMVKELFNNKIFSLKQIRSLTSIPTIEISKTDKKNNWLNLRTKLTFALNKNNLKIISFVSPHEMFNLSELIEDFSKSFKDLSAKILIIENKMNETDEKFDTAADFVNYFESSLKKNEHADLVYLENKDVAKILNNSEIKEEILELEKHYDYIFINSGSINEGEDVLLFSQLSRKTILILEENKNTKDELFNSALQLDSIENEILAILFYKNN